MDFSLGRALDALQEGKALGVHPALVDRSTPISVYSPGTNGRQQAVISQREAGHHSQAYGGRESMGWVYDAINLYADPVGVAPFHLSKVSDGSKLVPKKSKGTPPDHEVGPQDLYELLRQPNPFMLYSELFALMVIDLMLIGNAYWLKWQVTEDGKPLALYRLAPAYVKIVPGAYGPLRYEYQPPGVKDPMKIAPENLIHFRRPNPHSAFYGMGVIQGGGRAMDLDIAITDTMASYYENKAEPSLIVESERRVPRDVFQKLRAQLRSRVAGANKAGELLVLEAGLKANTLSRSAADALFADISGMSADNVLAKFRANKTLLGVPGGTSGQDTVADVRREFDNYALRPFMDKVQEQVSMALTHAWDVEFVIDYRTMLPPDDAMKVAGQIAAVPGIKVREVRKQFEQFGIEESTGDPKIDEMVLNLPTPEADENGQVIDPVTGKKTNAANVGADRNLPTEPGRPPKPSNTRAIKDTRTSGTKSLDDLMEDLDLRIELAELKAVVGRVERPEDHSRLPGENRPDDPFAKARSVELDTVMHGMTADLRRAATELERGLLDTVEGKALKTSDIVQRINRSEAWTTFKERVEAILHEGATSAARTGSLHTGKTPDEDIDFDALADSIVNRKDGIRSIMRTIKRRVANAVKAARDEDGERNDFEGAVQGAIADWTDSQAITIADSEATEAYNEAVLTTLEMVGEDRVFVTDGHDTDEPCVEADGSVWEIEHAREHRKEHPRCRRAFLSMADLAVE